MSVIFVIIGFIAVVGLSSAVLAWRDHIMRRQVARRPNVRVAVEDEIVLFGGLRIPISDVRVVGEINNPNGPWLEDWFLCLVTRGGRWHEIPLNSESGKVYDFLVERLEIGAPYFLCDSLQPANVIVWPADLVGQAIFVFSVSEPKTRLSRFFRRIGFQPVATSRTLTPAVIAKAAA